MPNRVYEEGQIWESLDYPNKSFEILFISEDRIDVEYMWYDEFDDGKVEHKQNTRLNTLIKRIKRNNMILL